jgi:hypothetical protein
MVFIELQSIPFPFQLSPESVRRVEWVSIEPIWLVIINLDDFTLLLFTRVDRLTDFHLDGVRHN